MPVFLDPRGHTSFGIAICDRCKFKRFTDELTPDPNYPGLMVCGDIEHGCKDQFDPWRLPARQTENITLRFVRPDVSVSTANSNGPLSVQQILAQRLVDNQGRAILDSNGNYIDGVVNPPPDQVPL
jgi:hypothetical protein